MSAKNHEQIQPLGHISGPTLRKKIATLHGSVEKSK